MWLAGDSIPAGTELCDPQQVVGGADQVGGETGPFDAPIARATEVADRLDPAENLLDPLAHALTHHVARPIGGAQVERRAAPPALILRHVGSDIERAATRHERRRVVALVVGAKTPVPVLSRTSYKQQVYVECRLES